jgi:ferritin-like metal-binding protein YciE
MMPVEGWRDAYSAFLQEAAQQIADILDLGLTVELITHRFTRGSKSVLTGWYPGSGHDMDEATRAQKTTKFNTVKYVYTSDVMKGMRAFFEEAISNYLPAAQVLYLTSPEVDGRGRNLAEDCLLPLMNSWRSTVMATDARSIYVTALRNTHAMEQQGLQQMEAQVSRLERYPDYVALLQRHIQTTRQQLARLEQALQSAGESISSIKETVTTVAGTIGATVHGLFQDETLKNLYAGYAYQYEQIGAYRSLITIAESAGETAHVSAFQQSVREEEQAAQEVAGIIEPVTRRYVELTTSGDKADR